jgi:hypothetical protein
MHALIPGRESLDGARALDVGRFRILLNSPRSMPKLT